MPEVSDFSEDNLPPKIKEMFVKARAGEIDPVYFLENLEKHKVTGIEKLLYTCRAFNLPLTKVKEIELQLGRGLTNNVSNELAASIDQLNIKDIE